MVVFFERSVIENWISVSLKACDTWMRERFNQRLLEERGGCVWRDRGGGGFLYCLGCWVKWQKSTTKCPSFLLFWMPLMELNFHYITLSKPLREYKLLFFKSFTIEEHFFIRNTYLQVYRKSYRLKLKCPFLTGLIYKNFELCIQCIYRYVVRVMYKVTAIALVIWSEPC